MKKIISSQRIRNITLLIGAMFCLSTLSFNCAPHLFEPAGTVEQSSNSSTGLPNTDFSKPVGSPHSLLTSYQLFSSMLNVTGQNGAVTTAQRAEYDARTASLADNDSLTNIGAPMQMATTSLAGEVCNGLIAKESANGAVRKFFNNINFSGTLAANGRANFDAAVAVMANSFWGRAPSSTETAAIGAYYTDWEASYPAIQGSTRKLYLSVCAAMLSSFDATIN